MPPYFPKPPIPRPQKLFIHSFFTLQKSLKNYPKHFKRLKIDTKAPSYMDFQMLPKSRLKVLQRRAKSLKVLDLEKHDQFFKLKVDQALNLIKSFSHISSLSLFGNICTYFSNKTYSRWFTQSKKLIHIIFGTSSTISLHPIPSLSLFKAIHDKYQKTLRRSKLLSLDIQSHEALLFGPESYPSTLGKLSLSPDGSMAPACPPNFFHFFHLHHLSILHLKFPCLLQHLLEILNSLPNPHKITHLTAFVSGGFDPNNSSAVKFSKALAHFQSLRSLRLELHSFISITTLSKLFKTPSNLQELSFSIPIQKEQELIELALFIGSLKNLSLLAIANSKSIQGDADKGHCIFFTQISGLSLLKSLEINLCGDHSSLLKSKFCCGCLGKFFGCVKRLLKLEEIKFTQSEIGLVPEFDSLTDAFKEKGSRLKKLTIKFLNGEKKIDNLQKLNKAFQTMENLEELSLENLGAQKESLVQFGEVVSELKWLKIVQLDGKNPGLEKADLVRTLKKILMKYGLEELKWFGNKPIDEMENFAKVMDPVDIKEVISRNPRLFRVCLDYDREKRFGVDFINVKDFLP